MSLTGDNVEASQEPKPRNVAFVLLAAFFLAMGIIVAAVWLISYFGAATDLSFGVGDAQLVLRSLRGTLSCIEVVGPASVGTEQLWEVKYLYVALGYAAFACLLITLFLRRRRQMVQSKRTPILLRMELRIYVRLSVAVLLALVLAIALAQGLRFLTGGPRKLVVPTPQMVGNRSGDEKRN